MIYWIGYLGIMNLAAFITMGEDKRRARKHLWRVPEKVLFLLAILGGSLGSIMGMQVFRHKTRHWYFALGMPAILLVHLGIAWVLLR